MVIRLRQLRESLLSGFWAIPAGCVVLAVVAAFGLVHLDRSQQTDVAFAFGAGPDGAREVLGAITTAMITFTGLVFSITVVVLQLTSSQFSPRVLRTFLRNRLTQVALGTFVATFVYAVLVLRTVDSTDDGRFVPAIATTAGVGLLLVSVGMFVAYIHDVATSIQVSSIIEAIGNETRRTIERRFPADSDELPQGPDSPPVLVDDPVVVPARRLGVITAYDVPRLVRLAGEAGVVIRAPLRLGDFVPAEAPLLEVHPDAGSLDAEAAQRAVSIARDRSLQEDVAFGFRQLVDIASRALSPGINDPTTAVQVLDQLHDLLRRLVTRPGRSGLHRDESGAVRLMLPAEGFETVLELALDEICQYGAESRPVQARVLSLLDDLISTARPEHLARVRAYRRAQARRARAAAS